jgi:hypothetical protein
MNEKFKKFLEMIVLTGEAIVASASAIKIILVAVGALALVVFVYNRQINGVEQQYIAQMRVYEKDAQTALEYAAQLQIQVTERQTAAEAAEQRASRLGQTIAATRVSTAAKLQELEYSRRAVVDSVEMARVIIPRQDSIIQLQKETIDAQDEQVMFLQYALVQKDTALMISTRRGDSLQIILNNLPRVTSVPRRPSLKTIFGAGVATGIVATVLLSK